MYLVMAFFGLRFGTIDGTIDGTINSQHSTQLLYCNWIQRQLIEPKKVTSYSSLNTTNSIRLRVKQSKFCFDSLSVKYYTNYKLMFIIQPTTDITWAQWFTVLETSHWIAYLVSTASKILVGLPYTTPFLRRAR